EEHGFRAFLYRSPYCWLKSQPARQAATRGSREGAPRSVAQRPFAPRRILGAPRRERGVAASRRLTHFGSRRAKKLSPLGTIDERQGTIARRNFVRSKSGSRNAILDARNGDRR